MAPHEGRQCRGDSLVLLGASRLLLDVSMDELRSRYPGSSVHMLGLNGKYPLSTLESLADDEDFTGTAEGFHPRRQIHGVAHDPVFHPLG